MWLIPTKAVSSSSDISYSRVIILGDTATFQLPQYYNYSIVSKNKFLELSLINNTINLEKWSQDYVDFFTQRNSLYDTINFLIQGKSRMNSIDVSLEIIVLYPKINFFTLCSDKFFNQSLNRVIIHSSNNINYEKILSWTKVEGAELIKSKERFDVIELFTLFEENTFFEDISRRKVTIKVVNGVLLFSKEYEVSSFPIPQIATFVPRIGNRDGYFRIKTNLYPHKHDCASFFPKDMIYKIDSTKVSISYNGNIEKKLFSAKGSFISIFIPKDQLKFVKSIEGEILILRKNFRNIVSTKAWRNIDISDLLDNMIKSEY